MTVVKNLPFWFFFVLFTKIKKIQSKKEFEYSWKKLLNVSKTYRTKKKRAGKNNKQKFSNLAFIRKNTPTQTNTLRMILKKIEKNLFDQNDDKNIIAMKWRKKQKKMNENPMKININDDWWLGLC